MTLKTALTAMAFVALPTLSFAYCSGSKEQQAQSCAPGSAWNAELQQCEKQVTG